MEFRAVEQLAEDQRDLLFENARAVVLHADFEAVRAGGLDMDPNLGQDAGLFASVERIVDRFLDGGEQGFARVVEAEQMPVLGKKLADADIALGGGHRVGGHPAAAFFRAAVRRPTALISSAGFFDVGSVVGVVGRHRRRIRTAVSSFGSAVSARIAVRVAWPLDD